MLTRFEHTWYQRYYRLAAWLNGKSFSKFKGKRADYASGFQYHHVRPVSLFGTQSNLVICVPVKYHARLHYLLWRHYQEKGQACAAAKMKYAYEGLESKFGCAAVDERFIDVDWKEYKRLMGEYPIQNPCR